ncbi:nitroreductase [Mycobacterium marseillense]|uniref:Nitroreductase n=3 Tax=Mycobacterium marseillense TaxID=701042 RepID=A0AAC9VWU3_9MYCO|nr:nitroreductase [Mycobacterium marseillense]OBJ66515.1 nitroreductase [Mycobacterium marseillense]
MRVRESMSHPGMQLYDVMRTTFAAREFTDDPLPDTVLERIFDNARFAPSGGNRQGAHITVVRDAAVRRRLAELGMPAARRYFAQLQAGEKPWNSIHPSAVPQQAIDETEIPDTFVAPIAKAPVVLVVSVDLTVVAALDQHLDRVGIAGGASVYPLIWNILLAARSEGYGGTITTMAIAAEEEVRGLLGIPDRHAVAAVVPLGKPVRQLSTLRRRPVAEFITRDRFDGPAFDT